MQLRRLAKLQTHTLSSSYAFRLATRLGLVIRLAISLVFLKCGPFVDLFASNSSLFFPSCLSCVRFSGGSCRSCVFVLFSFPLMMFFFLSFFLLGLSDDGEFEGVCVCASRRERALIEPA
jgi:hypothetical protein